MSRRNQIYSFSQWLIGMVAIAVLILVGGCGDFTTGKTAGAESTRIINDLSGVKPTPEPNVPIPSIYKEPPKIVEQTVGGATEYKLFYFCKHHDSDDLQGIVQSQFGSTLFDAKGKSKRVPDYTVSSIPATNQLIVRTPDREDIESVVEFLQEVDVAPIQVKIDCVISEVYADKTLDWETTLKIENLLGEGIRAAPAGLAFSDGVTKLVEDASVISAFPGASLRELARTRMGLKVGYLSQNERFLGMVDLLESQGYLKILMNPSVEVVNGKTVTISSSQRVPVDKTYLHSAQSEFFTTKTEWADVIDSLQVTPHVYLGDGSIGLETSIKLGSALTPEGIKQISIVTKKEIENKENRIRLGESLIIGGIRKSERRDVVRGLPFLKDIPLLGMLFSGRDFEERVVETVFILTPSISTGGIPRDEIMEEVERKRGLADSEDDAGLDPFGMKGSEKKRRREIEDAEQARLEAEAEKAVARDAVRDAQNRIERAEAQARLAKDTAERVKTEAEKTKAEAETARAEADAKAKAADEAKAAADKAIADAGKTKAEAEKLKAEADKAQAAAARATTDASKTKEEAQKDKADADAKAKAAEQAKAEADAKAKAADKAIAAADKAAADAAKAKTEAKDTSEKAIVEADAKVKVAEQAKAEAEAKVKAAEQAKADAEARANVAEEKAAADAAKAETEVEDASEKAIVEADANVEAAEQAKAEAEAEVKVAEEQAAVDAQAKAEAEEAIEQARIEAEAEVKAAEEQAAIDAQAKAEAEEAIEQARIEAEAEVKAAEEQAAIDAQAKAEAEEAIEQARIEAEAKVKAAELSKAQAEARAEVLEQALAEAKKAGNEVETAKAEQPKAEAEQIRDKLEMPYVLRVKEVAEAPEEITTDYAQITDFQSELKSILTLAEEQLQEEGVVDSPNMREKEEAELSTLRSQPRMPQVRISKRGRIGRLASALLQVNVVVAPTVMLITAVVLSVCWSVRKKHYISQVS